MSITAQLMADYDDRAGKAQGSGPLTLSAVLAHLLFLRANGGLSSATALCDTFGTEAFVSAAMACSVPEHFRQDMREIYTEEPPIPAGMMLSLLGSWPGSTASRQCLLTEHMHSIHSPELVMCRGQDL